MKFNLKIALENLAHNISDTVFFQNISKLPDHGLSWRRLILIIQAHTSWSHADYFIFW